MNRKIFLRAITLLMLLAAGTAAYAEEKTVTFGFGTGEVSISTLDSRTNKTEYVNSVSADAITLTAESDGGNVENQSTSLKIQKGARLIISAKDATITNVSITFTGSHRDITTIPDGYSYESTEGTWTGSADKVILTYENDGSNAYITTIAVTYQPITALSFADGLKTYNLTDFSATIQTPKETSANVTYTSSDEKVARIDNNQTIRFVNTGEADITATYTLSDEETLTAQYKVRIVAGEASYAVTNSSGTYTCSFADAGKFDSPVLTMPGLTVTMGNGTNAVIYKKLVADNDNSYGVRVIDDNGFTHLWYNADDKTPLQGTFYTFKPTVSGKLVLNGYVDIAGAVTWADNDGSATTTSENAVSAGASTLTLDITAGHTYSLYETIKETRTFTIFSLNGLTFTPSVKLASSHATAASSDVTQYSYTDLVDGLANATATVSCKGNVSSAKAEFVTGSSTDKLTLQITDITYNAGEGNGGAIVVDMGLGSTIGLFVLTIPYKTHTWDFTSMSAATLKDNTTDWALTYQVRRYVDETLADNTTVRRLDYLNNAVMTNATAIDGTNAYYIGESAGLLVTAAAEGWGAMGSYPGEGDLSLTERLNAPYTNITDVSQMTIYNGTTITIPALKKGQYVRMKWSRHAPNSGDLIAAKNVTDLDGTAISSNFEVGNYGGVTNPVGYEEFIVAANGDVSFTLSQSGWTEIRNITVSDNFVETDMRLYPPKQTTVKTYKDNATTINYGTAYGNVQAMSALGPIKYYIKGGTAADGSTTLTTDGLSATLTEAGALTVTGKGSFVLVQKGISNGYVLDMEETTITVSNTTDVTQTYPYTWDFTNISEETKQSLEADHDGTLWSNQGDGAYGLVVSKNKFSNGDELSANDVTIAEYEGLGITTIYQTELYDNVVTLSVNSANAGLKTFHKGSGRNSTLGCNIIIPNVGENFYVYIRCHRNVSTGNTYGRFSSSGGEALETIHEGGGGAGSEDWIYRIQGKGANVTINVQEYTIYKIGVTQTLKDFTEYDGNGYCTEYRDHNEKYDLTDYFTYGSQKVSARYVTHVNNDNTVVSTQAIDVAPAETGVILKCDGTANLTSVPLFVRDVNTAENTADGNLLEGVLEARNVPSTVTDAGRDYRNYVFTRIYYQINEEGKIVEGTSRETGALGFYKLATNDATQLKANLAYLHLPVLRMSEAKTFYLLPSLIDGTTGIRNASTGNMYAGDDNATDGRPAVVYYTIGGQRLNGRPTRPGIYIANHKKIVIR